MSRFLGVLLLLESLSF